MSIRIVIPPVYRKPRYVSDTRLSAIFFTSAYTEYMNQNLQSLNIDTTSVNPLASLGDLGPFLIWSSIGSIALLVIFMVIGAIGRSRERRAIIQTSKDIHEIKELLERHYATHVEAPRPTVLERDPQLPPRSQ